MGFSHISFVSFFVYLFFGFYVFSLNPKLWLNRIFLLMTSSFAVWALAYTFIFLSVQPEEVFYWYRISSIGWCSVSAFLLHFVLLFTKKMVQKKWLIVLIVSYLISLIFIAKSFLGVIYTADFVRVDNYWIEKADIASPWFIGYIIYNTLLLFVSLGIVLAYQHKEKSIRLRRQSLWVFLSTLFSVVLSYATNIVAIIGGFSWPVIGHLAFLFGVAGIVYAIKKYKLMTISYHYASEKIMTNMQDLLFLVDNQARVVFVNDQVLRLLLYTKKEILNMDFFDLTDYSSMHETRNIFQMIHGAAQGVENFSNREIALRSKNDHRIIINLSGSMILDDFSESMGAVFIGHDVREKLELAKANRLMQEELDLAQRIQAHLMPVVPRIEGLDMAFYYHPMSQLGGDFYDYFLSPDKTEIGIIIGDVSGHGVPAALISTMIKSIFESEKENLREPDYLIQNINNKIYGQISGNFLTVFYAYLDLKSGKMVYARGGHNFPFLVRQKQITQLASKGKLLGLFADVNIETKVINLVPGDKIFLYTDGLIEAENESKQEFGEQLQDLLVQYQKNDTKNYMTKIVADLEAFIGFRKLEDDVTMVAFEYKGM